MKIPRPPVVSARKRPRQARSQHLVGAILEAAIRVLAKHGARNFTTARVAAEAGVSVGSLYQYFPNKESILFRLQTDEWQRTGDMLENILTDTSRAAPERLKGLTLAFIRSECEEAAIRVALHDAAPLYRDVPETQEHRAGAKRRILAFMRELMPTAAGRDRTLAADLVMTTLSAVGKNISEQNRSGAEVDRFAAALAEMFCGYVQSH
jgi:AcrR family transcriptional regulator